MEEMREEREKQEIAQYVVPPGFRSFESQIAKVRTEKEGRTLWLKMWTSTKASRWVLITEGDWVKMMCSLSDEKGEPDTGI